MSKYHSRKITRDGMTFDSMKEFRRWKELQLLERAGKIENLRRQVKFVLIPSQYEKKIDAKTGDVKITGQCIERECSYYADFVYIEHGETVVEDAKGLKTDVYIMKRKLMLEKYGIRIRET